MYSKNSNRKKRHTGTCHLHLSPPGRASRRRTLSGSHTTDDLTDYWYINLRSLYVYVYYLLLQFSTNAYKVWFFRISMKSRKSWKIPEFFVILIIVRSPLRGWFCFRNFMLYGALWIVVVKVDSIAVLKMCVLCSNIRRFFWTTWFYILFCLQLKMHMQKGHSF